MLKFHVTIQRGSGISVGRWLWWIDKGGAPLASGDEDSVEESAAAALSTLVHLVGDRQEVRA